MPLRLPDRLPAIDILKNENIFVTGYPSAEDCDSEPDASEDNHRDRSG